MIVLKVHTPDGIETHRISRFPCRIGRALDNDIIINDRSVSGRHAVIDRVGDDLEIVDSGSRNGMRIAEQAVTRHIIRDPVRILFGEVSVDFRSIEENYENTSVIHLLSISDTPYFLKHPYAAAAAATVVNLGVSFLISKLMQPGFKFSSFVGQEFGVLMLCAMLGAALSVWTKFQTGRYKFFSLIFVLLSSQTIALVNVGTNDFVEFNLNSEVLSNIWTFGFYALTGYYFFQSLSLVIFPDTHRLKRQLSVIGLIAGIAAVITIGNHLSKERINMLRIPAALAYPIRNFSADKNNFTTFEADFNELSGELEKYRLEQVSKNAELE